MTTKTAKLPVGDAGSPSLERHENLGPIRDEWTELAERSGNPFATWQWAATWWEYFGRGRPLLITACRRPDGTLAAIIPLYVASRRPLRVLRFLGHGPGDILGPICAPEDSELGAAALRQVLTAESRSWDLLLAERLPGDRFTGLVPGRVLLREASPSLRIAEGATWEEYVASRSRNLRTQIRSRPRRLEREHEVRYRLTDERERLHEDLDTLFRLHRARWGEAAAFRGEIGAFHREFAEQAFEQGWLRLWFLEVNGRAVAARYGLRFGNVHWSYQSGRDPDPAWDRYSLGFLLLVRTIQAAFDDRLSGYSFLRGDEAYKRRFAEDDTGLETIAVTRGPLGSAALSGARAAKRMPPRIRRRIIRSLG